MKKNNFSKQKLIMTAIVGMLAFLPMLARATTTFPVDQAGMAAYVKLGQLTQANFDNAKQNLFESVESASSTYMVGVKGYSVDGGSSTKVNFHIYLATNGWLVVYLPKDQEPSRMINWAPNATLDNTLLKLAIEDAAGKIGSAPTTSIVYYDFAQPDAKKMTVARETVTGENNVYSKNFTVLVPGTVYQASYALKSYGLTKPSNNTFGSVYLDQQLVNNMATDPFVWGIYDSALFMANQNHTITLNQGYSYPVSAATLILYSVN